MAEYRYGVTGQRRVVRPVPGGKYSRPIRSTDIASLMDTVGQLRRKSGDHEGAERMRVAARAVSPRRR